MGTESTHNALCMPCSIESEDQLLKTTSAPDLAETLPGVADVNCAAPANFFLVVNGKDFNYSKLLTNLHNTQTFLLLAIG